MTDKYKYGTKLRLFGGLPENSGIGANCQTIEYTDENGKTTRVMIDAGVKLASKEQQEKIQGLNCFIPDFRQFLPGENGDPAEFPLDAILVTHAHADHLDALLYMFQYCAEHNIKPPRVYAGRNVCQRLGRVLNKMHIPYEKRPRIDSLKLYHSVEVEDLKVKSFYVNHPTPNACGYSISTPDGVNYCNQGDNRMQEPFMDVTDDMKMKEAALHSTSPTHVTVDSTSSGVADIHHITLAKAISENERCFALAKGKQIVVPVISRSIGNYLPQLLVAKKTGKKVLIDSVSARGAFIDWQNSSEVYYMENGEIQSTSDPKVVKKLREKGAEIFGPDDFKDVVWDFDRIQYSNANNYITKVPLKDRLILTSGAFAEKSEESCSGFVRLVEDNHPYLKMDNHTAVMMPQRIIDEENGDNLNSDGVIDAIVKARRLGADPIILNYSSFDVLERKAAEGDKRAIAILNDPHIYKAELQASGHSTREGTRANIEMYIKNAKNRKDFLKKGFELQAIAVHGSDEQRRNSENALEGIEGVVTHNLKNGDTVFLAKGKTEVINYTPPSKQKFLAVIKAKDSSSVILAPVDGNYEKTFGDDLLLTNPDYRPQVDRGNGRAARMVDKAHAQEERDGNKQSMNAGKRSSYDGKNGRHGKNGKGKNGKNAGRDNFFNAYARKGRER